TDRAAGSRTPLGPIGVFDAAESASTLIWWRDPPSRASPGEGPDQGDAWVGGHRSNSAASEPRAISGVLSREDACQHPSIQVASGDHRNDTLTARATGESGGDRC